MPYDSYEMLPKFGELNFVTAKVHKCHVQSSALKQNRLVNKKYLCTFIGYFLSTSALQKQINSCDIVNQDKASKVT
jgi:hypothetical protein